MAITAVVYSTYQGGGSNDNCFQRKLFLGGFSSVRPKTIALELKEQKFQFFPCVP